MVGRQAQQLDFNAGDCGPWPLAGVVERRERRGEKKPARMAVARWERGSGRHGAVASRDQDVELRRAGGPG